MGAWNEACYIKVTKFFFRYIAVFSDERRTCHVGRKGHCPKCRTLPKERWLEAHKAKLLPTGYFHLVFTLPHDLNPLIQSNPGVLLGCPFTSVNATLQAFAADTRWRLVGQLGFIGVLHTWLQSLIYHFHLHCLVPAGVWSFDHSRRVASRKKYLFRAKSLAKQFLKIHIGPLELRRLLKTCNRSCCV
jgi:hypothetical protein